MSPSSTHRIDREIILKFWGTLGCEVARSEGMGLVMLTI